MAERKEDETGVPGMYGDSPGVRAVKAIAGAVRGAQATYAESSPLTVRPVHGPPAPLPATPPPAAPLALSAGGRLPFTPPTIAPQRLTPDQKVDMTSRPGTPLLTNLGEGGPRVEGSYDARPDPNLASIVARVPTREQFIAQNYDAARGGIAMGSQQSDPARSREALRGILTSEGPANQSMVDRILSKIGGRMQQPYDGRDYEREAQVDQRSIEWTNKNLGARGTSGIGGQAMRLREQALQEAGSDRRQASSNQADLERLLIGKALDLESAGRSDEATALRALALEDRRQSGEDARLDKSLGAQKEIAGLKVAQQEDATDMRERVAMEREERQARLRDRKTISDDYAAAVKAANESYGDIPVPNQEEFYKNHFLAADAGFRGISAQGASAATGPNGEQIKTYRNKKTGGTMRGYLGADGNPVEVK